MRSLGARVGRGSERMLDAGSVELREQVFPRPRGRWVGSVQSGRLVHQRMLLLPNAAVRCGPQMVRAGESAVVH